VKEDRLRDTWMNSIEAIGLVLRAPPYRLLGFGIFALALTFYAFALPAVYTGGVIGLISLRYLDAELAFFAISLAALLSLALTLNIYAFKASIRRRSGRLGVAGALSSLLPATICCTPVVPTLLAILGATTPQIFGLTGRIQGFFATYESLILAFALILLLISLRLAAKSILGSCPLPVQSTSDGPIRE
jgi:hypothetical protein